MENISKNMANIKKSFTTESNLTVFLTGTMSKLGSLVFAASLVCAVFCQTVAACRSVPVKASFSAASNDSSIKVMGQSPFVNPGQTFNLSIQVDTSTPISNLVVQLTTFMKLSSRSSFDQSITNPYGVVSSTGGMVIGQYLVGQTSPAVVNFSVTLLAPGLPTSTTQELPSAIPVRLGIGCQYSACPGIYPLKVSLLDPVTRVETYSLVTHIVISPQDPPPTRLGIGLVIPLLSQDSSTSSTLSQTDINSAIGVLDSVATDFSTPITFTIDPSTLVELSSDKSESAATLLNDLKFIGSNSLHPFVEEPYSDIDISSLADSALEQDIENQYLSGNAVLKSILGLKSLIPAYVGTADLSLVGVSKLVSFGISTLLLPISSLRPSSLRSTATQPFGLSNLTDSSSPICLALDQGLSQDLLNSDPVLGAETFIGEASQVFFDAPNSSYDRNLSVLIPSSISSQATVIKNLLSGIADNPILEGVTLASSATAPQGVLSNPSTRELVPSSSPPSISPKSLASFNTARSQLTAASLAYGAIFENGQYTGSNAIDLNSALGDLYQSEALITTPGPSFSDYLSSASSPFRKIQSEISLSPNPNITLTSSTGKIPITVIASPSSPILNLELVVSSNGLTFHSPTSVSINLNKSQNTVYFTVTARARGSVPLTVSVKSPDGSVTLIRQQLSVHSTAISSVGVILSLGAALLVLWWWFRTARRKWISHRGKHSKKKVARDGQ